MVKQRLQKAVTFFMPATFSASKIQQKQFATEKAVTAAFQL